MAKTAKRQIGDTGEGIACKYLEGRGYVVLERNYLKPWGEIDIVAKKAERLYFIEVKSVSRDTRTGEGGSVTREPAGYRPEDNVHPAKLKRLHRAIQTYLIDHKVSENIDWQVDVACVYLDFSTRKARVEMLENVIL
ncbi:MAG TPA: YraN family protein [Candidatus Paceibacterota bacterium]